MILSKHLPTTWRLVLVVAGALLIYAGSLFSVTLPGDPIPQTGQTLGVIIVALLLAPIDGTIAVALYVLAGVVGLPLFSGGSYGASVLTGPSGGFLIGFILAAIFVGVWVKRGLGDRWFTILAAALLAHAIILLCGGIRLAMLFDVRYAWLRGVEPFLAGALVKSALGTLVVISVLQLLRNYDLVSSQRGGAE